MKLEPEATLSLELEAVKSKEPCTPEGPAQTPRVSPKKA